jgi:hypothetical protein
MEDSANKKNQNREDEVSALLKNYLKVHETFFFYYINNFLICYATDVTINHQ